MTAFMVIWVLMRDYHVGYVNTSCGQASVISYKGPFEDGDVLGISISCVEKDIRWSSPEQIRVCSCTIYLKQGRESSSTVVTSDLARYEAPGSDMRNEYKIRSGFGLN